MKDVSPARIPHQIGLPYFNTGMHAIDPLESMLGGAVVIQSPNKHGDVVSQLSQYYSTYRNSIDTTIAILSQ